MAEVEKNIPEIDDVLDKPVELQAGLDVLLEKLNFEKAAKKIKSRRKLYSRLVIIGLTVLIVGSLLVYFLSSASNVRSVKVVNNRYLSDEYIQELTGISTDSKYLLLFTSFNGFKAEDSPLIKDIRVEKGGNRSVVIYVEENTIMGYRYTDKMELVLGDGTIIPFESRYIYSLAILPMFMINDNDRTVAIAKEMNNLDTDIISRISEVKEYSLSYDPNMVKFVMDDGYRIYTSLDGVKYIAEYLKIITSSSSKHSCIFIDPDHQMAVIRDCKDLESPHGAGETGE